MLKIADHQSHGRNRARPHLVRPPDAVTVLTIYLCLLLVIPSNRGVGALGAAGVPASIFGLGALLWWCWHHIQRPHAKVTRDVQAVRIAMFCFVGAVVASYAVASLSALPVTDISVADTGLLRIASFAGVLFVANDGIPDQERFLVLIRRLCVLAGLYALLGLVQFFTGMSIVDTIQIPGLSTAAGEGMEGRAGFVRSVATARHPLEYAVVLIMALPFCLTMAIYDKKHSALVRWFPVAAITLSSVLSVTRSALIGLAAVFVVLLPSWPASVRRNVLLAGGVGMAAVYVTVPGMMGTIVGMFSGHDTSVGSRTDSYSTAAAFFAVNPIFGRGFGTFLPAYRILDNQYLSTLIETGLVGLAALLAVLIVAMIVAFRGRKRVSGTPMRQLGLALVASVLAGGLLTAFFDCFAFPQACGMIFFVAGLCGAYWNLGQRPGTGIAKEWR